MINTSRADSAYVALKQQLINCQLEPGRFYTEAQLSKLLGLGKTPTREALASLAQEGWVNGVKGRGYEVLPLSVKDIHDAYGARMLIEPEVAATMAGRLDEVTGKRLLKLCEDELLLDDEVTAEKRVMINREIHMTIVDASGNELLSNILLSLVERCERLAYLAVILKSRHSELTHHHRDIVSALIEGDGELAKKLTAEHLRAGELEAMSALLATPGMKSARFGLRDQLVQA